MGINDDVDATVTGRDAVESDERAHVAADPASIDPGEPTAPGRLLALWRRNSLKLTLVGGDVVALLLGSIVGHWVSGYLHLSAPWQRSVVTLVVAVGGVWCIRSQGLLLTRTSSVRPIELTKLARATMLLGLVLLLADRVLQLDLHIEQAIVACVGIFFALVVWRWAFGAWLTHERSLGRYLRPTIVLGSDSEAARLVNLLVTHRELGMDVLGLVGGTAEGQLADMWLGGLDDAEQLVSDAGASGVIVSPIGIELARFNALIRNLQRDGVHVFVSTGLVGIESRRVRSMALAHEPMLYVEPPNFNPSQAGGRRRVSLGDTERQPSPANSPALRKRLFDITVGSLFALVCIPFVAIAAIGSALAFRAHPFFTLRRLGHGGRPFTFVKVRSLPTSAPQYADKYEIATVRNHRWGTFLRSTHLDELPQLWMILSGRMSLVGPRPEMAALAATFDQEFVRERLTVRPGCTGLWQISEGCSGLIGESPQYDLHYIRCWTLRLDVWILWRTVIQMMGADSVTSVDDIPRWTGAIASASTSDLPKPFRTSDEG